MDDVDPALVLEWHMGGSIGSLTPAVGQTLGVAREPSEHENGPCFNLAKNQTAADPLPSWRRAAPSECMKSGALLKEKINRHEPTYGVIATFHFWPGLVEIAMKAGLDYLIIDLEHLTHPAEMVADACAIGRREGFPILVRPASAEFTTVRLAMDLGPCGLLIPYVQDLATMDEIRDAVHLKPRGRRRPGGPGNFWVKDYNYSTWKKEFEDDLIILPQIESKIGLENAEAIARHPITTAIAIGPYDLSADLGVCWQPESPELNGAIERIRQAGRAAGKNMWMIGDGPALTQRGFTFLCLTEPIMFLAASLGQLVQNTRTNAPAGPAPRMPLP